MASPPPNLTFVKHIINKRQGGARNTAIEKSNGDYIFLIDQDDFLSEGSIEVIIASIEEYREVDLIMFDSGESDEEGNIIKNGCYSFVNTTAVMSGTDFLCNQKIPWTPWHYLYRKKFLLDNNYKFEENVRFEDVDYVMRCTANAAKMVFVPETVIIHSISSYQTSTVGNSVEKILDLVKVSYRTGLVGVEEYKKGNVRGADAIISHHHFGYKVAIKSYIWRLPYSNMLHCLRFYPPIIINRSDALLLFVQKYPIIASVIITCMSPLLRCIYWAYSKIRMVKL